MAKFTRTVFNGIAYKVEKGDLYYPAHHHAAKELYFVLAGHAFSELAGNVQSRLSQSHSALVPAITPIS